MKDFFRVNFICLVSILLSCNKSQDNNSAGILGQWNIVADSTYTGAAAANHLLVYVGKSGDYYNFKTDGSVEANENGVLKALNYKTVSFSSVIIESFYDGADTEYIQRQNANNILVTTGVFPSPGGTWGRTLHLSR